MKTEMKIEMSPDDIKKAILAYLKLPEDSKVRFTSWEEKLNYEGKPADEEDCRYGTYETVNIVHATITAEMPSRDDKSLKKSIEDDGECWCFCECECGKGAAI